MQDDPRTRKLMEGFYILSKYYGILTIFKDGINYILSSTQLKHVIALGILANEAMSPLDSLMTPVVVEILDQNAQFLSLLNILLSIGVLIGGAVFPSLRSSFHDKSIYIFSFSVIAVLYTILPLSENRTINSSLFLVAVLTFYLKPQQNTPTSTGGEMNAGICLCFL